MRSEVTIPAPGSHEFELIMRARKMDAGIVRQVYLDAEDRPICMVITVDGREDCEAILGFIKGMPR